MAQASSATPERSVCTLSSRRLRAMRAARVRAAGACKSDVRGGETAAAFQVVRERDIGSHLRPRLTPAGAEPNFCRAGQEMVNSMTKSIRALLSSAAHSVVRGLAVVALVVVWSVGHIGTYALSVVGVSTAVLTTTATPLMRGGAAGAGAGVAGAVGGAGGGKSGRVQAAGPLLGACVSVLIFRASAPAGAFSLRHRCDSLVTAARQRCCRRRRW